ncbi:protease modulator HflK [Litorimonas cladophorae]|uniref:Protein HflK n=1 Tax=Litorimonas cladophorae TaxID=1220491 RepID=A0A918KH35_9PROT|nr:FtsH protease activity modulator HflK [Litorimonas cladophorae]GGX60634.1 protease modulator HflK [Litorimonas cladophorae]
MSDNNSPWGPKPGSSNGGGKGDGNSPWGGGQRPNRPQRPSRDNVIEGFKSRTGGGGNGGGNNGAPQMPDFNIPKWAFVAVPIVFLLATSVFTVQGNQEAAILRFGDYQRTVGPGLHFKLPSPIETKEIQDVTNQRETIVGISNNAESLMLTGDENIVDINFAVLWVIKDLESYLFKVDQPEDLVKSAAESVVREIIGKNELDPIITTGRQQFGGEVRDRLQELLDEYEAGVLVNDVQFQKTDPPAEVVDDFLDVVNASQEAERAINEARAYRNTKVLEAEGEAAKIIQQAEGYRDRVIADAEGEAQRFELIYGEYKLAPQVTRQRMYLETMELVYGDAEKIVLDGDAGSGVVPYLPLDQLNKKGN